MQAKSDEMFADLAYKYVQKVGKAQENPKFFFNGRELVLTSGKTLAEYSINNNSKIDVVLSSTVIGALWNLFDNYNSKYQMNWNKFILIIIYIIKNAFNY